MNTIPSVLTIQDFCCVGRCALAVTIPVLSAMEVQPVALPTSFFSNTPFYSHLEFHEMTEQALSFIDLWKKEGITFDALQSGFLSSPEQIHIVKKAFETFGGEGIPTIVDPAMADHGALYGMFDTSMIDAMKELLSVAQITTPNYTEALLMTGRSYSEEIPSLEEVKLICGDLYELGPKQMIITSIPTESTMIRTALFDSIEESFTVIDTPKVPLHTAGTGDIFTAVLTGSLTRGLSLEEGARRAVSFTYKCIKETHATRSDPRQGVLLERLLPTLMKQNEVQ